MSKMSELAEELAEKEITERHQTVFKMIDYCGEWLGATYYKVPSDGQLKWYVDSEDRYIATKEAALEHFASPEHQAILIRFALGGNQTARDILALLGEV